MNNEYLHRSVNFAARSYKIRAMSKDFFNTFGKRVRVLREDRGLTQEQLAELLSDHGVTVQNTWISTLERAKENRMPATDVVIALAKALHTTTDYLLMLSDEPRNLLNVEPVYMSPQADEAARMIDGLRDPTWRDHCITAIREILAEYEDRNRTLALLDREIKWLRDHGAAQLATHIERELSTIAALADRKDTRRTLEMLMRLLGSGE